MSKNGNENVLLKDNKKLIETEQKLISEGIIFKRRILSHKKENKNVSLKTNNNKKDLSIKITDQYIKKSNHNFNYNQNYNNNIPLNSMRTKKTSFTKMNQIPINDPPKSNNIKRNNYIKANNIKKKNFSPVPRQNNIKKNILKENSYRNYKSNTNRKSLNIIDINDKNILLGGNLSPRTSDNKFENGHTSPMERSKYYLNTNIDIGNGYDKHKFNYKKWNKITVNNIFDKDINIKMYESPKNNNGIDKENNGLINNQNRININDNGIQEIVIQNIKKQKNIKINDIPLNRKKINSKDNINNNNNINNDVVNRNNIFSYCKQMSNLALTKEEKNNFIGETVNGLKFDQIIRSPEVKNKIKVCNTNIKRYKSSNKKSNSIDKILTDNVPLKYPEGLGNIELKNQKSPPKNKTNSKNTLKHCLNKSQNLNNKYNLDSQNKGIYRNECHSLKPNANTELNTNVIKIKNSKLIDYIKTDDANINNKKEIIFNKYKDEDEIKEDNVEEKNELYEINEEIFNSNTDLFNEKDKGLNNYTFDNKYEIDSEPSFKMLNNYNNNIFDNDNKIINLSNNISKNNINEIPYSLKHNVFTKKKIGGINLKINNISNNIYLNDKNYINTNNTKITNNTNSTKNSNNILIEEKEKNKKGSIFKNNNIKNKNFNGDYMELAKICYNQEKIISNLVKNVQQLNNQICDKDLCINELNNQLYSIKYDLLNTLQKTNSK